MPVDLKRVLFYLYSALFVFTPLVMFHRTSELFEFNKLLFIYLISSFILATWIARMIVYKKIIIQKSILAVPFVLFLASQILSTYFSIDLRTSIYGYYGRFNGGLLSVIAYMILFFGFISNFNIKKEASKIIRSILISSLIGSALVMLWGLPSKFGADLTCLVFTGSFDVGCWTEQFKPTIRMFSTLGQPNWLGAYLAVNFFIGIYYFLRSEIGKWQYIYGFYLAMNFLVILFTRSRSALLAVFIGTLLMGTYLVLKRKDIINKNNRIQLGVLALVFILPILIGKTGLSSIDQFITLPSSTKEEAVIDPIDAETEVTLSNDHGITDSFSIRKIVWQGGYNLGMAFPLTGTGVETFAYSYNFTRPQQHNLTTEWDYVYNKAHNEFVNFFATSGAPGVISYMLIIAFVLVHMKTTLFGKVKNRDHELLVMALLTAYSTIVITNFFGFSTTTVQLYFYILPAMIALLLYNFKGRPSKSVQLTHMQKYMLLTPGLIAVVGVLFVVLYFAADTQYAKAENFRHIQDYSQAQKHLYNAYSLRKEHVYADKIASNLAQMGFLQAASGENEDPVCVSHENKEGSCITLSLDYMQKALLGSTKNPVYYRTLARNRLIFFQFNDSREHFDKAVDALRQARALAPSDPRYPYNQALFYLAWYENVKNPTQEDITTLETFALGDANFAIKLKPDYRDAYYVKGLIHKELDQDRDARLAFEYILENLNPSDVDAERELEDL